MILPVFLTIHSLRTFTNVISVNGTMFIAVTDTNLYLTPFNLTMINPHVISLGLYQAG